MTMVDNWLLRADPEGRAINDLTYGELLDRARRARVPEGVRVGIALPPGEEFAIAMHAIWMRGSIAVPHDLRVAPANRAPAEIAITEALDYGDPIDVPQIDLSAPAALIRTSGTTGQPKLVTPTFGNLLWSALGSAAAVGLDERERWLCALPLSHVGGLSILVRSAIYGTEAIVHQRWDTEDVLAEDPTVISLVPTTLKRLLDADWTPGKSLRWALIGGAPLSPELRERARQAGVPVAETYGLTEACSQVTVFGAPLFCTNVRLGDDGEIFVSGPTVIDGKELATGDLGAFKDDQLVVTGRKSDTIITGGENVSPTRIEAVLEEHPAVSEALVSPRSDAEWGQAVIATIVLAEGEGEGATESELKEFCFARLAPHEIPKEFGFAAALQRTTSGKLVRQRV
jgi:O-succinylbenzoic acid--CoA ligase